MANNQDEMILILLKFRIPINFNIVLASIRSLLPNSILYCLQFRHQEVLDVISQHTGNLLIPLKCSRNPSFKHLLELFPKEAILKFLSLLDLEADFEKFIETTRLIPCKRSLRPILINWLNKSYERAIFSNMCFVFQHLNDLREDELGDSDCKVYHSLFFAIKNRNYDLLPSNKPETVEEFKLITFTSMAAYCLGSVDVITRYHHVFLRSTQVMEKKIRLLGYSGNAPQVLSTTFNSTEKEVFRFLSHGQASILLSGMLNSGNFLLASGILGSLPKSAKKSWNRYKKGDAYLCLATIMIRLVNQKSYNQILVILEQFKEALFLKYSLFEFIFSTSGSIFLEWAQLALTGNA